MSVFASLRTATLSIPRTTGATVSIRGLSPRALEAAQKEHQRQALQAMREAREAGGEDALGQVDPAAVQAYLDEQRRNPLLAYDAESLVVKGVTAWTLELPHTAESVAELDEDVRDYIATEILKLSKPSLFRTVEEQEADQKEA